MSDTAYSDLNRFYRDTQIGNVQAWPEPEGEPAVVFALYASVMHAADTKSYITQHINLTVATARDLAHALIEAADHADKVRIVVPPVEEAA